MCAVLDHNYADVKMQPIASSRPGFMHEYQSMSFITAAEKQYFVLDPVFFISLYHVFNFTLDVL